MNKISIEALACALLLSLAACGSGPSDADIGKAMADTMRAITGSDKPVPPAPIKESKCAKSSDGDSWDCDFLLEGEAHHGRFVKFGDGWKLVGQLG